MGGYSATHGPHQRWFIRLPGLTNPDLTWETQEQLNFGIDARFLNNRLGEFDLAATKYQETGCYGPVLSSSGAKCSVRHMAVM